MCPYICSASLSSIYCFFMAYLNSTLVQIRSYSEQEVPIRVTCGMRLICMVELPQSFHLCLHQVCLDNSCLRACVYVPEYVEALAVRNYVPDSGTTSQQLQHLFPALLVLGQSCSCVLNKLTALLSISCSRGQ